MIKRYRPGPAGASATGRMKGVLRPRYGIWAARWLGPVLKWQLNTGRWRPIAIWRRARPAPS